jgi:osmotically-inducible protein OsmY
MSRAGLLHSLPLALVLTGALPGCAAYRHCGLRGCPGDANISAAVETQLARYPALQGINSVRVQTLDRVVYLYGLVDTELERELAESVAINATDGARVVNSIAVNNIAR